MAISTDVKLPRSQRPVFPDRCVMCGAEEPGRTIRLFTSGSGWWSWFSWLAWWPFSARVPACGGCGWRLRMMRWGDTLLVVTVAVAVIWMLSPWLREVPRPVRKWLFMGAVGVSMLPWYLWKVFVAPPFDITAGSDGVDYEFRDPVYALQFAMLNDALEQFVGGEDDDGEDDDGDGDTDDGVAMTHESAEAPKPADEAGGDVPPERSGFTPPRFWIK